MISSVRGIVQQIGLDHAVVEVGGVGLAVHATPGTLAGLRRGEPGQLATALVVREDSLTLFGFADEAVILRHCVVAWSGHAANAGDELLAEYLGGESAASL